MWPKNAVTSANRATKLSNNFWFHGKQVVICSSAQFFSLRTFPLSPAAARGLPRFITPASSDFQSINGLFTRTAQLFMCPFHERRPSACRPFLRDGIYGRHVELAPGRKKHQIAYELLAQVQSYHNTNTVSSNPAAAQKESLAATLNPLRFRNVSIDSGDAHSHPTPTGNRESCPSFECFAICLKNKRDCTNTIWPYLAHIIRY